MEEDRRSAARGTTVMKEGHRKRLLKRLSAASSSSPQLAFGGAGYRSQEAANSCICFSDVSQPTLRCLNADSPMCQRADLKDALARTTEFEISSRPNSLLDRPPTPFPSNNAILSRKMRPKHRPQIVDFMKHLPPELRIHILGFLKLDELVRCSAVRQSPTLFHLLRVQGGYSPKASAKRPHV